MDLEQYFETLKNKTLTNLDILNTYEEIGKSQKYKIQDFIDIFSLQCTTNQLRGRVATLKRSRKKLRGEALSDLLNRHFTLTPAATVTSSQQSAATVSQTFETIQKDAEAVVLESQNTELKKKIDKIGIKLRKKNVLQKSRTRKIRQMQSTLNSKRLAYIELRRKLNLTKRQLLKLQNRDLKSLPPKISELKGKITKLQKMLTKLRMDNKKLSERFIMLKQSADNEQKKMKEQNDDLKESLTYAESLLNEENELYVFDRDNNSYTTDFQLCVMNLLSQGVGVHHVNNVIESVAALCGKNVEKLPSVRTINRIGDQRLAVSQIQLAEELTGKRDTTLMSDETRKHGECFEMFSVQDPEGRQWVLGLKEMENKSSQSCLDTLKYITEEINKSSKSNSGKEILSKIKNTMSDRAATEKHFHDLLQDYREEILPSIYSNWLELSEDEQKSLTKMNNFYCGLHLLVNFAEVADGVISKFEKSKFEVPIGAASKPETAHFMSKQESGTVRLIRTSCKSLARGADEKSGCYRDFHVFMKMKDQDEEYSGKDRGNILVPFRGNRFNIIFYNAEILYYLSPYIREFFGQVHVPTNLLQKSVSYDMKEDAYLAICKALGLCSKLITAPFWRIMESDCSLQEASDVYQTLKNFLSDTKNDATSFVCGNVRPFPHHVKEDAILDSLLTTNEKYDAFTAIILQNLFTAWEAILLKAAAEHLEGGAYAIVGEQMEQETKSVPRHNKFPERVFALLDALTRFRPVASTLCNEAYVVFSLNKTYEWLQNLTVNERETYLTKARTEGRELRKRHMERTKEIETSHQMTLKKKRQDLIRKKEKIMQEKESIINDVQFWGFWQYPETVDSNIMSLKTMTEKKNALKAQLRFRKTILGQETVQKNLFLFSEKGKDFSVDRLAQNLKTLIRDALSRKTDAENPDQSPKFIGKRFKHYFMMNDERTPFLGRAISMVPGYPAWMNVIYDGDLSVYVYKLGEEYENGDLEIIEEPKQVSACLLIVHGSCLLHDKTMLMLELRLKKMFCY